VELMRMPQFGSGMEDAEIVEWLVQVGDAVAVDQPFVTVESTKATQVLESPFAGTVLRLFGAAGDTIDSGEPLIAIGSPTEVDAARAM
jgi:pyruvate dehydrogenase E2 component (dihydrolipoamide acetyltransferase)